MKKKRINNSFKSCGYILLLTLGLILPGNTNGQQLESGGGSGGLPIVFGPKLGISINSFSNEQPHNNITLGFTGGAFVKYAFNNNIAVQIEALYIQQGGRLLYMDMPNLVGRQNWYMASIENQRIALHNLNIPVLFRYNFPMDDLTISAVIGPDLGFNVSAISQTETTVFTEVGSFHTYTENKDITSNTESFNMAASIGGGIEIPTGDYMLLVDVRYRYGFTPVYKSYSYVGIPQISDNLNNHSLTLTIGLGFWLSK